MPDVIDDVSLGGGTPPPAAGPSDPGGVQQVPQFSFSEVTDGQFNSWEEVSGELSRLRSASEGLVRPDEVFASPALATVNEMLKSGEGVEKAMQFLRLGTLDTGKMSDADVVREALRIQYPTLTPKQVEEEFHDLYGADPEDEGAVSKADRNLKKAALEARSTIEKAVEAARLPVIDRTASQAAAAKATEELQKGWSARIGAIKPPSVNISLKVDGQDIEIQSPVTVDSRLAEMMAASFAKNGEKLDGFNEEAVSKQLAAMAISSNHESYLKSFAEQVAATVTKSLVSKYEGMPPNRGGGNPPLPTDGLAASQNALVRLSRGH